MIYQHVIPYSSALPNKICYKNLFDNFDGWRFMLSPASIRSVSKKREHLLYQHGYALDNGAYSFWKRGIPFPTNKFLKLLSRYGQKADWIVLPDVVENWEKTQETSFFWYEKLKDFNQLLVVAQNGAEKSNWKDLDTWIDLGVGVFVGGCDIFKLKYASTIIEKCRHKNVICHVGRVNSSKRARWCESIGAYSFDGSGMSRFKRQATVVSRTMYWIHNQSKLFDCSDVYDYQIKMNQKYKIKRTVLT